MSSPVYRSRQKLVIFVNLVIYCTVRVAINVYDFFVEHQSIDLVFSVVFKVVRVFPGRSVKNALRETISHGRKMMSLFLFVAVFVLLSFSLP